MTEPLNPRGGFYASESKLAREFGRVQYKLDLILRYLVGIPRPLDDKTVELQAEIRKFLYLEGEKLERPK